MTNGAGAAGAAAYAAMINAVRASGAIVEIDPIDFLEILNRSKDPIVVHSPSGVFTKNKYMTSYKGLFFYAKSPTPLPLPPNIEQVAAKRIWIPG